jgi:DNA-binding response OmpR family regulator
MKILLVEDEPDLGVLLQKSLTRHQYGVDWAQDGEAAWDYLTYPQAHYTLAIVDWMLPQLSGVELCQRLRSSSQSIPVLMLTARDRMEDKIAGLDAGADDYLVKPFGIEELLARMRALQRRSSTLQTNQLQIGELSLNYGANALQRTDSQGQVHTVTMTAKEFQLLEYFFQHPGQILSHDQIRNRLWELDADTLSNVISAQIYLLRKKLAEVGYESAIETMRGLGYRLNIPASPTNYEK